MADLDLEELASLCLQRMQEEGQHVLEEICDQYPDQAAKIRGMVGQLEKMGLMEDPSDPDLERLGEYRILRRLGGGGMGVVYLAVQESLGRKVAIKVMRPGYALHGKSQARFRREIEAISAIDHPGVCTVYEAGEEEGRPYLAMRYIEGESLAQILRRRRGERHSGKPTSTSAQQEVIEHLICAEKAARALHTAHEAGLIHRDVKPANLMIDSQGEPVILDFGLVQEADADQHDLTASGDLLGTPPYMAPEQVQGRVVDRRCDIYSLAATLYECLTLRCPFEGENRQEIYSKILDELPPNPRRQNRWIGRDLWVVISKALEKDPAHRFATAEEFADELRRILHHEPIRSVRPSLAVRSIRWTQRNRAATTVLVTMALALVTSLWFLRQSQISEDHAIEFLEKSRIAERRLQARAWMGQAIDIESADPTLAFKLARKAYRLARGQGNATVQGMLLGRIQSTLFRIRPHKVLTRERATLNAALFSSKDKFLLYSGMFQKARLFTGKGQPIEIDLPVGYTQSMPAAFSPDETEMAIVDDDGFVHRFDLRTLPPREVWQSKLQIFPKARSVAYRQTVRGLRLLVCSAGAHDPKQFTEQGIQIVDNRATVWDLEGGEPLDIHHSSQVVSPWGAWLPGDRILMDGVIWDLAGKKIRDLEDQPGRLGSRGGAVFAMEVVQGEKYFVTVSLYGSLRVYTLDGVLWWKKEFSFGQNRRNVSRVQFDPSGGRVLLAFIDGGVHLLDLGTRTLIPKNLGLLPRRTVMAARFSPDGERIAVGYWNGKIRIFGSDLRLLDEIDAGINGITALAWSADRRLLASGSLGGVARLWDRRAVSPLTMHRGFAGPRIAVSPHADRVVIVGGRGRIRVCDGEGKRLQDEDGAERTLFWGNTCPRISPDGKRIVLATSAKNFQILDLSTMTPLPMLESPVSLVPQVTRFLDDTEILYRARMSQNLRIWNPDKVEARLLEPKNQQGQFVERVPTCSDVSADGKEILIGYWDGYARILSRFEEGKELWKSPTGLGMLRSVRFSPDARLVLMASENDHAHLFDRETGEHRRFGPHFSGLLEAIFSPDGKQIVTAARCGLIRVWDRFTGRRLATLRGHEGPVNNIRFVRPGRLVSAGFDGTVRWWWTTSESLDRVIDTVDVAPLTAWDKRVLQLEDK